MPRRSRTLIRTTTGTYGSHLPTIRSSDAIVGISGSSTLFEHVRAEIGSNRRTFSLFGLSAGAQYVFRYLALMDAPAVDMAVAANCGWYMTPDLGIDYPVGMGGLDLDESHLRRYLERQLIVMLGDADTDPAAHDPPRSEAAMAQEPHRLARGLWLFELARIQQSDMLVMHAL
jgi:hypothetical protein